MLASYLQSEVLCSLVFYAVIVKYKRALKFLIITYTWNFAMKYRTTSVSAHANEFFRVRTISQIYFSIFFDKNSNFEQFLEILGLFEQENLDLK